MKKLFAILLCIVMMLSMVACGSNKESTAPKGDPTEADLQAIAYYENAIFSLNKYAEEGTISFNYATFGMESDVEYVFGQQAVAEYYNLLSSLSAVDTWVGTEYTSNPDVNWDRKAVLNSFVVVENILVDGTYAEKRPNSEPTTTSLAGMIKYGADGKVSSFSNAIYHDDIWEVTYDPSSYLGLCNTEQDSWAPEYDADGKITKLVRTYSLVSYGEVTEATETRTFTYDASGNRIKEHLQTAKWDIEYTYTYDAGRLSQISWNRTGDAEILLTIDYTYDNAGTLIQTVEKNPQRDSDGNVTIMSVITTEYTYNSNGQLAEKTVNTVGLETGISSLKESQIPGWEIRTEQKDQYTYTYDAHGNLQTKVVTYGDTYYYAGSNAGESRPDAIESEIYEYVFGNYYIYTPAQ